tara:strand:+ start:1634 stop:1756 length:123 start_codon:yes stop_codon:yes gene_type:complete
LNLAFILKNPEETTKNFADDYSVKELAQTSLNIASNRYKI